MLVEHSRCGLTTWTKEMFCQLELGFWNLCIRYSKHIIEIAQKCIRHTSGLSNLNQPRAANCQFQLSLLTGHKSVANHRSLPLPQWREEKEKITIVENWIKILRFKTFLSTLFHIFNNFTLDLFYFGSLAGRMKLPRGLQVGKPCHTSYVIRQIFHCDSLNFDQIRAKGDYSSVNHNGKFAVRHMRYGTYVFA